MCEYRERPAVVNRTNRERGGACAPAVECALSRIPLPASPGPRRALARQPSRIIARLCGPFSTPLPLRRAVAISPLCCFATPLRRTAPRRAVSVYAPHYAAHFIRRCDVIHHVERARAQTCERTLRTERFELIKGKIREKLSRKM